MKKIVKASIATTAGVVLLLGGAGTFATWNSSATAEGASIVAGNLVVEASQEAGTWTANGSAIDIADYVIVPGDVLTYTKTMNVGAEGDSLSATLALTDSSIAPADPPGFLGVARGEPTVPNRKDSVMESPISTL